MRSIAAGSSLALGALLLLTAPLHAQDETLIRGGAGSLGFYLSPVVKLTEVSGRSEVMGGMRAGVIFGRRFGVGIAGYHTGDSNHGLRGPVSARPDGGFNGPPNSYYGRDNVGDGFGYGGLELEYLWQPAKLVHASISTLVGGGSLDPAYGLIVVPELSSYRGRQGTMRGDRQEGFFVAEPAAHAEVNVVKHVRLSLGVGYRFTAGGNRYDGGADRARGATGTLAIKFGKL